jgi:hypothetical protein
MFVRTRLTYHSVGSPAVFVSMNIVWGASPYAVTRLTRPVQHLPLDLLCGLCHITWHAAVLSVEIL